MTSLPENINEIRSRALLSALHRRALRDGIPMVIVTLAVGILAYDGTNSTLVLAYVVCGLIVQGIRYYSIPRLDRPAEPGTKERVDYAVALAFMGGSIQASSIMFFSSLDDASRSIYTMIIFGVCTGHTVGSHGHLPTFLAFAGPQLLAVAVGWIYFPLEGISNWEHANVILIGVLGVFLYFSSRDVFRAFESHCILTEQLQTALESETNANAAKTRFLASASHDLRQPLHTMSMLSAALTLRPLDSESASIANRISNAMGELATELDSLLDISKMDAGATRISLSQFPVNPLIERLVRDYEPDAIAKNLDLSGEFLSNSLVETDRVLLDRTIRNLVDNAVKYTDKGSIVVKVFEHDANCVIQIEDTGVGIPEADQKRVYEEFYQIHNPERDRKNGLGLGLSIVSRIVNLLDGKLQLVSTPGVGSTFSLSIPGTVRAQSVEPHPHKDIKAEVTAKSHQNTFEGIHTLIVEDNREVRQSMKTLLEAAGGRVSEAISTCQAIMVAKSDMPDILLLDIRLPAGDSGYHTITQMRSLVPGLPVIIISGELISNDAEFVEIDNCEYFVKPVNMAKLFRQMHQMLKSAS
ncbi:MAG: hybrid sensor histidine kinase/response regulator [Granulosicoccus sp.]